MIDLHSHILPGLDDGARTLEESLAIARAAVASGVATIAATPHVREDYPTSVEAMLGALAAVQEAVAAAGLPLEVIPGGELALDALDRLDADGLRGFALGGSRALLVETPYWGWPLDIAHRLYHLQADGFTPVLAHPERNADVQEAPERLRPLVERGVVVQITAASLDGRLGRRARATGAHLLESGLAHLLASDAHAPEVRQVGMAAAVRSLRDDALGDWLVRGVPGALLAGAPIPEPPAPRRRRRLPWRT